MVASDSLFLLVKSLDKNEKRYFKLFVGKYSNASGSNYLKLFDEVDKMKNYDEEVLKTRNKKEKFVRSLPVEKHNLYKMILKSLSNYYTDKPIDVQLKEMIIQAQILLQKNLFRDFEKQLLKAKKKAYLYERWMSVLEIITLQRRLTREGIVRVPLTKWIQEEEEVLGKLSCEYELRKINSTVTDIIDKSLVRSKEKFKQLRKLLDHDLLSCPETNFSFISKRYKYSSLLQIHRALGNEAENYINASLGENLFLQYQQFIEEIPDVYTTALVNRIIAEGESDRLKDAFENLEKLKLTSLKFRKKLSDAQFNNDLLAYYALKLELLRQVGDFERARKLLPEMRTWLISCKHLLDKQNVSVLYITAANICFTYGEYKASVKWLMEILNDTDIKKFREDVQCFARMINVVAHYKLGHFKQLPKLIRSTFRFLLKKKKLYQVELCIINFVRKKMPKKNIQGTLLIKFKQFKKELEDIINNDKNERKVIALFDFISWLESEITYKPMIDVVASKTGK